MNGMLSRIIFKQLFWMLCRSVASRYAKLTIQMIIVVIRTRHHGSMEREKNQNGISNEEENYYYYLFRLCTFHDFNLSSWLDHPHWLAQLIACYTNSFRLPIEPRLDDGLNRQWPIRFSCHSFSKKNKKNDKINIFSYPKLHANDIPWSRSHSLPPHHLPVIFIPSTLSYYYVVCQNAWGSCLFTFCLN